MGWPLLLTTTKKESTQTGSPAGIFLVNLKRSGSPDLCGKRVFDTAFFLVSCPGGAERISARLVVLERMAAMFRRGSLPLLG